MAIVLAFDASNLQAAQIIVNWDGGGDGHSWCDADNWDPNIVPDNDGNNFNVTIDSNSLGLNHIITMFGAGRTVDQLFCYGNILFTCGNPCIRPYVPPSWPGPGLILEHTEGLVNHDNLEISSTEIRGNIINYGYLELADMEVVGDVTNCDGAKLEFEDPGAEINGNLYNLAGGRVEVESSAEIKEGDVDNAGLVVIYSRGEFWFENQFRNTDEIKLIGGSFLYWEEERGHGVLDNNSPGLITGFGTIENIQSIQNNGEIRASGGALAVAIKGDLINEGVLSNMCLSTLHIRPAEDVNNQGNIVVNPGGGVAFDCNLVNEPNATIQLNGGTLALANATITQHAGAAFEGFGGISGDVIIEPNAIIKFTASTNVVGNVEISENATLEIRDGVTLITGRTTCNGTIRMKGGYIIPQGGLSGTCNVIWEPGLYTNVADFNLDGNVNFEDYTYFADTWLWQTGWL